MASIKELYEKHGRGILVHTPKNPSNPLFYIDEVLGNHAYITYEDGKKTTIASQCSSTDDYEIIYNLVPKRKGDK